MKEKTFDLEDRLIAFAVRVIRVAAALPIALIKPTASLNELVQENDELISIFVTSVKTAMKERS